MASKHLLFLVILALINFTLQDVADNKADSKDESPLSDVAREILKEKNLDNIGGMVNSFIQSGGAKQIMDGVLQNLASGENGGQLLETLGGFLNSADNEKNKEGQKPKKATKKANGDVNPMDILSGIGSLVGALQGADGGAAGGGNPAALLQGLGSLLGGGNNQGGGVNTAAILQGLGSILASTSQEKDKKESKDNSGADLLQGLGSLIGAAAGNQEGNGDGAGALLQGLGSLLGGGQGGQGGISPEMIGNVINMFADSGEEEKKETKPLKATPKKAPSEKVKTKKDKLKKGKTNGLEGVLSLATSLLGKSKNNKKGDSDAIDFNAILENLPFILKMAKSLGGEKAKKFLDPLDDIVYIYNDAINDKKKFNVNDHWERFLRIYKAYNEVVAPLLKDLKLTDKQASKKDDSFDLEGILNLAGSFLSQGSGEKGKAGGEASFMDYLPMIINTFNAFTGPEAQERADSHADHSWSLPPVLEKIHVYFDNFLNSDMGKNFMNYIGGQPTFKVFRDEKGNFSYEKFEELIENHSFRRHWIQQVVGQIVDLLQVFSDEKTYNQYIEMSIMFTNSFLKKSGFPKKAFLDPKKPAKSITNFANYAARKYLGTEFDTKEYIEPAVIYIQDLLKLAHKSISPGAQPKELTEKLTNTINMEIIEPVTRVNRAFRFAKAVPNCDKYVFCLVNQEGMSLSESVPNLKKGLYKGSSLIAGWFLSSHTGTSYWDLYAVITENKSCKKFYHESCNGFHEEEIKATTEYVHSEL